MSDLPKQKPESVDDLKRKVAEADQADVEACGAEVKAALKMYECDLVARPIWTPDGRCAARVDIVKKRE